MSDVVKGGAFAVLAVENSTATDHPEGTCVSAKGEGIVCTAAAAEEEAQAEGAAGENQTATDDENGNEAEDNGANNGNGNEAEDGESEVTQNATMLNTTGGNTTGNGTMMAGNSTTASASGSEIDIAQGSSAPSNAKFYEPPTLTVPTGTTVTWKNIDSTLHTVTSGSAESGVSGTEFDSSYMAGGKTFQHTFSSAGTFDYYCTLHPFMKGQVVVN
jgi:plastocyanin